MHTAAIKGINMMGYCFVIYSCAKVHCRKNCTKHLYNVRVCGKDTNIIPFILWPTQLYTGNIHHVVWYTCTDAHQSVAMSISGKIKRASDECMV